MSMVRTDDGLKGIVAIQFRDAASVLKSVATGQIRTATGLKTFFSSMTATAAPDTVSGIGNSSGTVLVVTTNVTAAPVGGVSPWTVLWTRTDADPQSWTINSPTAFNTTFQTAVDPGTSSVATFVATITDAVGAVAVTNEVTVTCTNLGGGIIIGGP